MARSVGGPGLVSLTTRGHHLSSSWTQFPRIHSPVTHYTLSCSPWSAHGVCFVICVMCSCLFSRSSPLVTSSLIHLPSCFPDCLSLFRLLCFLFWACLCPVCTSLSPCPPAILCPVYVLFSVVMLLFSSSGWFHLCFCLFCDL